MRRTAVTGIGVIAPGGIGREQFWSTITAGRTSTRRISLFDASGYRSQIAAECDFDPAGAGLTPQEIRRQDRYIQFAAVAAVEAVAHSSLDLDVVDHDRMAASLGSAYGGIRGWTTSTW